MEGEGKALWLRFLPEAIGGFVFFLLLLVIPGKGMRRRWELLIARFLSLFSRLFLTGAFFMIDGRPAVYD